jgi:hypothetical protein
MEKARMTRHGRPVVREVAMKKRLAELGGWIGAAPDYRIDSAKPIPRFTPEGIVNYSASACLHVERAGRTVDDDRRMK